MKKINFLIVAGSLILLSYQLNAQNVGINSEVPETTLDVRGTDDLTSGGELQLATPNKTNFLRLFGGRLGDRNPFLAFHDNDSFHIVTTLPDFSTYKRRMTILPDGKVGIGIDQPKGLLNLFSNSTTSTPQLRITEDQFDFARLKMENTARSNTYWDIAGLADTLMSNAKLNFFYSGPQGIGDRMTILGNGNVGIGTVAPTAKLHVFGNSKIGGLIEVFNTGGSVYVGAGAGQSDDLTNNFNTGIGDLVLADNQTGINNVAIGARALQYADGSVDNVAIGRNSMLNNDSGNFNVGIGHSTLLNNATGDGNVAIGYLAGLNETGSNKLYIDNSSTTAPLIYGDFNANLLRTNGRQEVTDDFSVTGNAFFVDQSARFVGVGTTSPQVELHVKDAGFSYTLIESGANNDPVLALKNTLTGTADSQWTLRMDGSESNRFQMRYNNSSKMVLSTNGDLALGTSVPVTGYKLSIDGKIIAEEMRIQLSNLWPDYVFKEDYKLIPLEELDKSIKEHGHLPGIPKAEIINSEGFDTGEMQRKMMEKIEELTLYIIDLKKENKNHLIRIETLEINQK